MEDLLKVILVIATLAMFIIKAVNKSLKTEPAKGASPGNPPVPPQAEPRDVPLPEAWKGLFPIDGVLKPKPLEAPQPALSREPLSKKHQPREAKPETIASRKPSATRNIAPPPSSSPSSASDEQDDFALRSAEEARKAIVWGEILQRKY